MKTHLIGKIELRDEKLEKITVASKEGLDCLSACLPACLFQALGAGKALFPAPSCMLGNSAALAILPPTG